MTADRIGFDANDFLSDPAAATDDDDDEDDDADDLLLMTKTRIWSDIPRSETHSTNVSNVYSSPGTSIGTRIRLLAILKVRSVRLNKLFMFAASVKNRLFISACYSINVIVNDLGDIVALAVIVNVLAGSACFSCN